MPNRDALFGGSFDPPHKAHIQCLQQLLESGNFDRIFVIPSKFPPGKEATAPFETRLAWVKDCFKEPGFEVLEWEAPATQSVFAKEIVEKFQRKYRNSRLFWILGEDQFSQLEFWQQIDSYAGSLEWFVLPRGSSTEARAAGILSKRLLASSCSYEWALNTARLELSSTEIRERCSKPRAEQDEDLRDALHPAIWKSVIQTYRDIRKGGQT